MERDISLGKRGETENEKTRNADHLKTLMELYFIVMTGGYDLHTEFLTNNKTLWNVVC